ncbi:hypothetical protein I4F81_010166 [Pyropia yezoensis]|uniref:Uncharacterized protein n=1 Tax=Pyropia yezoensis TaxID=2788 RepID=A0ACC3CBN2_PYRYE|nr:hypothetical protein I4F81_010166 [Neopyropia yezoensis]
MQAVFLHIAGDFAGAALISASCTTLWLRPSFRYGWALDPAASFCLVAILLATAVPLAVRSGRVLLCGVPPWGALTCATPDGGDGAAGGGGNDADDDAGVAGVAAALRRLPGVSPSPAAVHDLRLWQLSDTVAVASVHLVVEVAGVDACAPVGGRRRGRRCLTDGDDDDAACGV